MEIIYPVNTISAMDMAQINRGLASDCVAGEESFYTEASSPTSVTVSGGSCWLAGYYWQTDSETVLPFDADTFIKIRFDQATGAFSVVSTTTEEDTSANGMYEMTIAKIVGKMNNSTLTKYLYDERNIRTNVEYGTWTPECSGKVESPVNTGIYTKIGNIVTAYFAVSVKNPEEIRITGLPFEYSPRTMYLGTKGNFNPAPGIRYSAASGKQIIKTYCDVSSAKVIQPWCETIDTNGVISASPGVVYTEYTDTFTVSGEITYIVKG